MTDEIYHRRQLHEETSHRASEAAQELARVANTGMITGPAAYAILGNLKLLLYHLTEVTNHLPDGLRMSLRDENITVTDQNVTTGAVRSPHGQISSAVHHLAAITAALDEAFHHAESAQTALSGHSFEPTALSPLSRRRTPSPQTR